MRPRNKKKVPEKSIYRQAILKEGKHLTHHHISKIKCFMDDPAYSRLDIAILCGVRVGQVSYAIRKIKSGEELFNEFKHPIVRKGFISEQLKNRKHAA